MSNIHSLDEFSRPPARPMANPWRASEQGAGRGYDYPRTGGMAMGGGGAGGAGNQMQMRDPFWSHNLPEGEPMGVGQMCCMQCCPCLIGPLCSPVRKADWKRFIQTFTFWISLLQIVVFIVEAAWGGLSSSAIGPDTSVLIAMGAKVTACIMQWQLWRLLTPILLHGGIFHILANLYFQLRMMLYREAIDWGLWRTVLIYVVSGVSGTLMSCILYPNTVSVGASGALMGVMGAWIAQIIFQWRQMSSYMKYSVCITMGLFVAFMLLFGFTSSGTVDQGAHLGGLVMGLPMGLILLAPPEKRMWSMVGAVLVAGLLLLECVALTFWTHPALFCP